MSNETFDFVICGAGSAGCVLADRLSQDGRYSVCVLEAGGMDSWIWFHIPVGYLFAIGNPKSDWLFKTEAEPGLNGRSLDYPRGRVIGGSSSINAMLYMRGQASDYDSWRQIGLPGWGWEDVLPYFIRQEDYFLGANEFHGAGGQWRVDKLRLSWKILDRFIDAAEQSGIPRTCDFNTGNNEGCGYFNVNQKNGRRWSAARGFLKPALARSNLSLRTNAIIDRLTLDGKRVTGVVVRHGPSEQTIGARFGVMLAAGSVASSAILERSGIGRAEILQPLGIEVRHALPGIGENLHDHLQIRPIFRVSGVKTMNTEYKSLFKRAWMGVEYALFRTGPLDDGTSARSPHPYIPRICNAECAISYHAAFPREIRRVVSSFWCNHGQRMQSEADKPRFRSCEVARSVRCADHPIQLSFDDRGPTDCR